MTNSARIQQDRIEHVQVAAFPVPVSLSSVEEVRHLLPKGLELVRERHQRLSFVFLPNQVETHNELGVLSLDVQGDGEIFVQSFLVDLSERGVDEFRAEEVWVVLDEPTRPCQGEF